MSDPVVVPSIAYSIFLAILQGVTEFLPVSSSGHLAAAQWRWPQMAFPGEIFEVAVHVGTTVAVMAYYRRLLFDIAGGLKEDSIAVEGLTPRRWVGYIVLASIPTAAIGLGFEDTIRGAFEQIGVVIICFAISGVVLMSTRFVPRRDLMITPAIALAIGVVQGAAILPGISRSGMTISLALLLGVAQRQAVTFSFLVSIPAILGATAIVALDLLKGPLGPGILFVNIGFASLCAGAIGYVCIGLVHRATEDRWWHRFAWYLWGLALVLAWLALGVSV